MSKIVQGLWVIAAGLWSPVAGIWRVARGTLLLLGIHLPARLIEVDTYLDSPHYPRRWFVTVEPGLMEVYAGHLLLNVGWGHSDLRQDTPLPAP